MSKRVTHRTVDEIWYILSGKGQMWRWQFGEKDGETIPLEPGLCLTIPVGTHFQFRAEPTTELEILGVTMPGWPQDREEAVRTEDDGNQTSDRPGSLGQPHEPVHWRKGSDTVTIPGGFRHSRGPQRSFFW